MSAMTETEDAEPETYQIMRTIGKSLMDNDNVDLEQYLLFWEHVCNVMGSWGTIFNFVVKDVMKKLEKLGEMRSNDPESYGSILTMATKESEAGTIRNLKPNRSGTGHLMVLNRALEFVIDMLDGVFISKDDTERVSTVARASYEKHLSQFHSWPIRATVSTALYTLPRKSEFMIRLRGRMPEEDDWQFHEVFNKDGRDIVRRVNLLIQNFDLANHNPSA